MTISGKFCEIDNSGNLVSILAEHEWMPLEVKNILNLEELPVVYFEETSSVDIVNDCLRDFIVGLTFIRKIGGDVLLACLTTKREIYVLNMIDLTQMKVLEELIRCDIRFYCLRAANIHFRFKERSYSHFEYLINMNALDIFFSMRKKAIEMKGVQKHYTLGNLAESSLPFHDKYELIQNWLGVSVDQKTAVEEKIETELIWAEPYEMTARNVIRFRCWFTRALGCRMSEHYREYVSLCGSHLYDFALLEDHYYEYFRTQIESDDFSYSDILGALNQCAELNEP